MKTKTVIVMIFLVFGAMNTRAFKDVKGVVQFDQSTYQGSRQNWSVSISNNGTVYIANHTGLLTFDGTNWTLNELPNQTIVRAVKAHTDSIIYTGGYMELGYWKPDVRGDLVYTSLVPKAEKYLEENPNMEFWNITMQDDYVYFQAFNKVLTYHNDSIFPINLDGGISVMNRVNDKIIVSVRNNGIWEVQGENVIPVTTDEALVGTTVKFIIPFKEKDFLIGTAEKGIFCWDGKDLVTWNEKWTNYFIENELNRGYYTSDDKIITGTLVDGIVMFDTTGNVLMQVSTKNGLSNNTVLGIDTDAWNNIWLALDIGIGFVPGNQNRSYDIQKLPGAGAIYDLAIFENKLYLGTNQGLIVKKFDFNDPDFSIVPETQDQIWDLEVIGNQLLIGHNQGTFLIKNGVSRKISEETGAFNFVQDPYHPELILQSTYTKLVVFERNESGVAFRDTISGFTDLIRYIEFDHSGNIWASHMHRGIYKIRINEARTAVLDTEYYGKNVFGKDHSIHVFNVEKRIVFTSGELIYTYDDLKDTIVPYHSLNESLGKYKLAHRIVEAPNHHYWFIGADYIGLFSIVQNDVKLIREYPTTLFNNPLLVEGYENLLPLNEYSAILCLQNGIALLDASVQDSSRGRIGEYAPALRHIELSSNNRRKILPLQEKSLKIRHNFNTIDFRFSFPMLSELPVSYRYFLNGLNEAWSEEIANPNFRFERLPRGHYILKVKAIDLWGNESQTFNFAFDILPPLSASRWAVLVYTLVAISALLMFRRWGIRQTRNKIQRQQDKREKELIRLRNEKLNSEVSFKSKDLANSTMAIIRKNEFLIDLKKIIKKQKDELGSRYPDKYYNYLNRKIDESIASRDDRQIFENNFERAHEQFFQKMKTKYPELTSSDLQLCAYLRMNLSSKEIAPLLGISVRGVENHRYRLRKKLELEHDESLADKILSI